MGHQAEGHQEFCRGVGEIVGWFADRAGPVSRRKGGNDPTLRSWQVVTKQGAASHDTTM